MADKTAAHAEKGSAAVRKPLNEARGSLRPAPAHPATALTRAMNTPASALTASDLLLLQRTAGNRAVAALLAHGNPPEAPRGGRSQGLTLQAKLAVGATNDSYEREADRVAAEVVQRSEPSVTAIQRQPSPEEDDEEEMVQAKPLAASITPLIQRQEMNDEEEEETPVQRRVIGAAARVEPDVERRIEGARMSGQPLPGGVRQAMEPAFGADFSGVRVHTSPESHQLNIALQARAFTSRQDIFFRQGAYNPDSRSGQELLAHELTHVVQQSGGASGPSVRSAPSHVIQRNPVIDAKDALEEDRMAWKMMSKYGKAAALPLAPVLGPLVTPLHTSRWAYNQIAADKPGFHWTKVPAVVAGALAFGLGVPLGVLRGLAFGLGNPLQSVRKRLGKLSPNSIRGIYTEVPIDGDRGGRRDNYNYDTATDVVNYGMLIASGGGAAGKFVVDQANVANTPGMNPIVDSTPLTSGLGQGLSFAGAGAGVFGAAASLMDARAGYKELRDTANTTAQRGLGLANAVGATASAGQQAATSAFHLGNALQNPALSLGAQTATGGFGVATGAVDLLRGAYGAYKAHSNIKRLKQIEEAQGLQENTRKVAEEAKSSQERRRFYSAGTGLKGAVTVAGGSLLLASAAATPIGWALLAAAGLIGLGFAIKRWWDKRKRKEAIAVKDLGLEGRREQWQRDVAAVKKQYDFWEPAGRSERKRLGRDPLELELERRNYKDVGHYYANYLHRISHTLYRAAGEDALRLMEEAGRRMPPDYSHKINEQLASVRDTEKLEKFKGSYGITSNAGEVYMQAMELCESMGLKLKLQGRTLEPTPDKIAKALDH